MAINPVTKHFIRKAADAVVQASKTPTTNSPPFDIVWAVVQSLQTGPNSLTIRLLGSSSTSAGIRYDNSYSPTAGDTVWGFKYGTDLVIVGKLA